MPLWNNYQDFLVIAQFGSLSGAARHLGVSQPTLSRRLATLEHDVGVRLMARTPSGLSLTPAGERVLSTLSRIDDRISQMEAEVLDADVSLSGIVRVTVTETLGITWIAPLIVEFNEAYPHIQVELVIDNGLVNLLAREAHISVRLMRPLQGDLITRQCGQFDIALYASCAYVQRYGLPENKKEAAQHRAVGLLGSTETAMLTTGLFPANRHVMQSNSLMAVAHAVRAGLGIGPVITLFAETDEKLVRCENLAPQIIKQIWLTAVPELRDTARIRAVFDFLADRLSGLRPSTPR